MRALAVAAAMAIAPLAAGAEEQGPIHFQATVATQAHPAFQAAYSGKNSLRPDAESATSVVMDLFLTLRPWAGAELLFQPELVGGRGLSSTLGVAAFPSGEVYRVGNPDPTILVGRAVLKQAVGPLTFTAGKYSIPDLFDLQARTPTRESARRRASAPRVRAARRSAPARGGGPRPSRPARRRCWPCPCSR